MDGVGAFGTDGFLPPLALGALPAFSGFFFSSFYGAAAFGAPGAGIAAPAFGTGGGFGKPFGAFGGAGGGPF